MPEMYKKSGRYITEDTSIKIEQDGDVKNTKGEIFLRKARC